MSRVDLDSPEHELCSEALRQASESRQELQYLLARSRAEVERLRRTMSHAANMLVSFDRFNLVRTARRELLAALSEGEDAG